jgi:adenylate cyclase
VTNATRTDPGLASRILVTLFCTVTTGALLFAGGNGELLRRVELLTVDWRYQLRGPIAPSGSVTLVMIDDQTIEHFGRWPLPRGALAQAIRQLQGLAPRVLAFDLLFLERNGDDPSGNDDLASALAMGSTTVLPFALLFGGAAPSGLSPTHLIEPSAYPSSIETPGHSAAELLEADGVLIPALPQIPDPIDFGHVTVLRDVDGSLRYDLPVAAYDGLLYPSLAMTAVRHFWALDRTAVVPVIGAGINLGPQRLPLAADMRQMINAYGPPGTLTTVSLVDVLQGRVQPELLHDKLILVGASATGVGNRFVTPYSGSLSGTEHIGTSIDNILSGRGLIRGPSMDLAALTGILLGALAAAMLAGRSSWPISIGVVTLLGCAWLGISLWAFAHHLLLNASLPLAAIVLSGVMVETLRLTMERRQRRELEYQTRNLSRYFAPGLAQRLAQNSAEAAPDRAQVAAVMFVDMMGFTEMAARQDPVQSMRLLRQFHGFVASAVFDHGGMVDKFLGDGAMACFGVPDTHPRIGLEALQAARALLRSIDGWNQERAGQGLGPISVGIGIHQGPVLMGDLGGAGQVQFTVVGDTVNIASRLESLTRQEAATLVVSDAVISALPDSDAARTAVAQLIPMPDTGLRGRPGTLQLYKLPHSDHWAAPPGHASATETHESTTRIGPK